MRLNSYSSWIKVLLILVVVSLASGAAAWAAPSTTLDPIDNGCVNKAQPNVDGGGCCNQEQNPKVAPTTDFGGCCYGGNSGKLAPTSDYKGGCCNQEFKLAPTSDYKGGCCYGSDKLAPTSDYKGGCCYQQPTKLAVNVEGQGYNQCCEPAAAKLAVTSTSGSQQDCPPPPAPVTTSCQIDATGVVGKLFADQAAYYAPGQLTSPIITINAGTYVVGGIATDASGNQFYRIVISCQYLYVPIASMGPNPDPPQNGEALPTTPVS